MSIELTRLVAEEIRALFVKPVADDEIVEERDDGRRAEEGRGEPTFGGGLRYASD